MLEHPRAAAAHRRAGAGSGAIGRSPGRKEDRRLLTGRSCFVDDMARPGALRAAILRSPYAHARIASIDTTRARARAGVHDVLTAGDLPPGTERIPMRMFALPGMERLLQPALADGVVRYAGEPVAVVVSEPGYGSEDALDAIEVRYEPLTPVLEATRAEARDAPLLHPEAASNVAAAWTIERGDVEREFAEADVVVEARLACGRHGAVPLEPRGLVAEVDAGRGNLTVWGAAKIVHTNRDLLSRMLGWPKERIRLVELDVGGGFGGRGEFYPEDFLIPLCAIRSGRPVAWTEDRAESLHALNHSREQVHEVAMALRADGTFLALRDRFAMDTGAYVRTHGSVVPGMTAALLPGPYAWAAYRCDARQILTNKTPAGTYRAPGRYEANLVRERIIDLAARRLGRDPADLRRQNLIAPEAMPYATGTHTDGHPVVLDSGDYPLLLDKGLERFDYRGLQRWRASDPGPRRRRGLGIAMFVEKSGIAHWEYARVGISRAGRARVLVGSASVGQGVDTVLAQICAEAVGVDYADVDVAHGDTAIVPIGVGSFGSRATSIGGTAVMQAAEAVRERLMGLAAEKLEASPEDLVLARDAVHVAGSPSVRIALDELVPRDEPWLEAEARFDCEDMSFPYGLHCAALEVDLDTGAVVVERYAVAYDVGRAINPQLVDGQIVGGVAQGIGGALLEEFAYDESGQLVSASFMDYLLPTAVEVPPVEVLITEDAPTPLTPLGAKGAGEGGTAAVGAAIANAVSDALGADVTQLPLTPARVLALARRAGRAGPHHDDRGEE